MSRSLAGADQCLKIVSNIANGSTLGTTPLSFAVWFKRSRSSHSEEEVLVMTGVENNGNSQVGILINTDNTITARTRGSANTNAVSSATVTDTDTWHLVVGVFGDTSTGAATISSRSIYIDGNAAVTNTDARTVSSSSTIFVAGSDTDTSGALSREFGGLIAYLTIWEAALSAANVASLWNGGAGADPLTVASPAHHWDFTGNESPEVDDVGAADLTVVGATFSTDDPFVISGAPALVLPATFQQTRVLVRM